MLCANCLVSPPTWTVSQRTSTKELQTSCSWEWHSWSSTVRHCSSHSDSRKQEEFDTWVSYFTSEQAVSAMLVMLREVVVRFILPPQARWRPVVSNNTWVMERVVKYAGLVLLLWPAHPLCYCSCLMCLDISRMAHNIINSLYSIFDIFSIIDI